MANGILSFDFARLTVIIVPKCYITRFGFRTIGTSKNEFIASVTPQSDDHDFWDVWTRKMVEKDTIKIETKREINWK